MNVCIYIYTYSEIFINKSDSNLLLAWAEQVPKGRAQQGTKRLAERVPKGRAQQGQGPMVRGQQVPKGRAQQGPTRKAHQRLKGKTRDPESPS